ncbi:MAG: efflux transporter periplasmic adaptor subunit [Acidobacteria bacterium]|nr:efflux transporter periplasmic adaptor subunit [Acidobacteriota bacterium]
MGMDKQIKKKKWPPKKIIALSLTAAFIILVLYVFLFKLNKSSLNVKKERITISSVTRGPFQEFIPVQGEVMPLRTHYIPAGEGGRIVEIFLEAGTMVNKGDPILRLENTDLLMTIMWREAEFFQTENNLRNTQLQLEQRRLQLNQELAQVDNQLMQRKKTYDRYEALIKDNLISKHEYELSKSEYDYWVKSKTLTEESIKKDLEFREAQVISLEDNLRRMRSNLDVIKQKQDSLIVRAPETGHLTALVAEIGQQKRQGEELGQIDILDGFRVRARIDEYHIARVEPGKFGSFEFGAGGRLMVTRKYPEVTNGQFEVDMEFADTAPTNITRGQTLHIKLELSDVSEAILVPRGGFFQSTGGNWVYVVNKEETLATQRRIRINRQNTEVFEVLEGLEPGEKVITSSYESFGNMDQLILK